MYTSGDNYSPYEVDQLAIKVAGDDEFTRDDCVGKMTVERETKTVTKKCRGVIKKRKTKATGNGTITLSLHCKLVLYRKLHAITNKDLQPGVYAFDNTLPMPEFTLAARVKDEDDVTMFKGFPRCKIEEINTLEIENGGEEVAEIELKASFMPDDYNKGEYEGLEDEMIGQILNADNWMTDFSSEIAQLGYSAQADEGESEKEPETEP